MCHTAGTSNVTVGNLALHEVDLPTSTYVGYLDGDVISGPPGYPLGSFSVSFYKTYASIVLSDGSTTTVRGASMGRRRLLQLVSCFLRTFPFVQFTMQFESVLHHDVTAPCLMLYCRMLAPWKLTTVKTHQVW